MWPRGTHRALFWMKPFFKELLITAPLCTEAPKPRKVVTLLYNHRERDMPRLYFGERVGESKRERERTRARYKTLYM